LTIDSIVNHSETITNCQTRRETTSTTNRTRRKEQCTISLSRSLSNSLSRSLTHSWYMRHCQSWGPRLEPLSIWCYKCFEAFD